MKKKIVTILIIATITTLGLFGFWSKNYLTALWHFKSDNPERHRLAFFYLDEISGSLTIELFERLGDELQKEVYRDYQNYKRAELIKRYNNTLIAYVDDDFNVCIRTFNGEKIVRFKMDDGYSSDKELRWSNDGKRLVVSGNGRSLYITDLFGENVSQLSRDEAQVMPDWSFDDSKIVLSNLASVNIYDITSGEISKVYKAQIWQGDDSDGKYSPFFPIWVDDRSILVSIKNNLEIINTDTRQRRVVHSNEKANKSAMASLSGENFTFGMKKLSYSRKLVAMEGGSILNLDDKTVLTKGFDEYPTWAPDDEYIMFHDLGVDSNNPEGIQVTPYNDDERLHNIKIYMGPGRAPAWSPPLDNYDEIIAQMDDNKIDYNFELKEPLF